MVARVFPRLALVTCICFELSLVVFVRCDWPLELFWFYDTHSKTALMALNCLQMKAFFERSEAGTSENARTQAIERTQANIDWLKKYEDTITKWLEATVTVGA